MTKSMKSIHTVVCLVRGTRSLPDGAVSDRAIQMSMQLNFRQSLTELQLVL